MALTLRPGPCQSRFSTPLTADAMVPPTRDQVETTKEGSITTPRRRLNLMNSAWGANRHVCCSVGCALLLDNLQRLHPSRAHMLLLIFLQSATGTLSIFNHCPCQLPTLSVNLPIPGPIPYLQVAQHHWPLPESSKHSLADFTGRPLWPNISCSNIEEKRCPANFKVFQHFHSKWQMTCEHQAFFNNPLPLFTSGSNQFQPSCSHSCHSRLLQLPLLTVVHPNCGN